MPFDEIKLLIPKPPGAQLVGVEFAVGTQFSTNLEGSCPAPADFRYFKDTTFSGHEGVLVNFRLPQRIDLPEPFVGPLVEGEIHLRWVPQPTVTITAATPERARCKPLEKVPEAKNGYFPPVYDFTNGIRFGFTLETNDNTNAREIDIR